jgi:hypothetical protein
VPAATCRTVNADRVDEAATRSNANRIFPGGGQPCLSGFRYRDVGLLHVLAPSESVSLSLQVWMVQGPDGGLAEHRVGG